jgi:hypothetical protein
MEEEQKLNDEELAAIEKAAKMNADLLAQIGSKPATPTHVKHLRKGSEPLVPVTVPKQFTYRPDHHGVVVVHAGHQEIPEHCADHWWFKANGVKRIDIVEQAAQKALAAPFAPGEPQFGEEQPAKPKKRAS